MKGPARIFPDSFLIMAGVRGAGTYYSRAEAAMAFSSIFEVSDRAAPAAGERSAMDLYNENNPGNRLFIQGMNFYNTGVADPQNYAEAARLFMRAAEKDHARAQYYLGHMYDEGLGVEQDPAMAINWYMRAAAERELQQGASPRLSAGFRETAPGDPDAQYCLGAMYFTGRGTGKDCEMAVKWFLRAAVQGHADAEACLGAAYYGGQGVRQNFGKAVEWFLKAADQGNAGAQANLGTAYAFGRGARQDYNEAVKWYRKAAVQGDPEALFELGWSYEVGHGVEEDQQKAVELYRKAAVQGHQRAIGELGNIYARGECVQNIDEDEVRIFRSAAENGDSTAECVLAEAYHGGYGGAAERP